MSLDTSVTTAPDSREDETRRRSRRAARHEARRTLWRSSSIKRVAFCGRFHNGRTDGVQVKLTATETGTTAGFSGLQHCGSVWACPVCSEKIQAARQAELQAGLDSWLARGGGVLFGTLTLRHNKGHRLSQLLDAISPSWQAVTSRASAWRGTKKERGDKERFGIVGFVRLLEIKDGDNGWHPHVHFLLFTNEELDQEQRNDLSRRMFGRWETALAKHGLSVIESVGIDLRPVADAAVISDYLSKHGYQPRQLASSGRAAYEVTSSQSKQAGKGGRTPFELLAAMVAGEQLDEETGELIPAEHEARRWREYEQATSGRRQLTWSRGLRDLLLLDPEADDQELVEDDQLDGVVLVELTAEEWKLHGWAWRSDQLLTAAEDGSIFELLGIARGPGELRHERYRHRP